MTVLWTAPADADLNQIEHYIAADKPEAAAEVAARILEATEALKRFPLIGRAGRVEGTRELVVAGTPYILAYAVRRNRIVILAAIHGSRAWPEEFDEQ